ncbi:hypothetical protein ACHAWF_018949 [Thalassiosira exigua]
MDQPHIISVIKKEFGAEVEKVRKCLTPGTPSIGLILEADPKLVLSTEMHHRYHKDVFAYCNSGWVSDPDSRRSTSGYIIYVNGIPVCCRTRAQRSVALSSTEAEWYALSE